MQPRVPAGHPAAPAELNRKFIKDINSFYGEYQAGEEVGSRAPLVNYTKEDVEPSIVMERGDN